MSLFNSNIKESHEANKKIQARSKIIQMHLKEIEKLEKLIKNL